MTNNELRRIEIERAVSEYEVREFGKFREGPLREELKHHLKGLMEIAYEAYVAGMLYSNRKQAELAYEVCKTTLTSSEGGKFLKKFMEDGVAVPFPRSPQEWLVSVNPSLDLGLKTILQAIEKAYRNPMRDKGIASSLARSRGGKNRYKYERDGSATDKSQRAIELYKQIKKEPRTMSDEARYEAVSKRLQKEGIHRSKLTIKADILKWKKTVDPAS